jgi:membrane protease YdiL (CAAX protease family)
MITEETMPAAASAFCAEAEAPPATGGAVRQSIWLLLLSWTVLSLVSFALLGGSHFLVLGHYQLAGFLLTAFVFVKLKGQNLRRSIRLRWVGGRLLVFAAMIACGASAFSTFALAAAEPWIGPMPDYILQLMPATWQDYGMMLLIGCVGAGVCEEIFFRGLIQGVLSRRGRWVAILLTALLFGIMHMNLFQFTGGLIMGIILGWLVERGGSLLPAMVMHATVNGLCFTWFFAKGASLEPPPWWMLAGFGMIGLMGLVGFLMFTANRPRKDSSLKEVALRVSKKAWVAVLAPLLLFGGVLAGNQAEVWSITPVKFEVPELGINNGDHVVSLNVAWLPVVIKPGDGVLFLSENQIGIGSVVKVGQDHLVVEVEGTEYPLSRSDLVGKIVHKLRLPWWAPAS